MTSPTPCAESPLMPAVYPTMAPSTSSSSLSSAPTSPASTLTELSRSPSPALDNAGLLRPRQNLTPPSSQGSSPGPESTMDGTADRDVDAPSAKRRKLSHTPRTTSHLDLRPEASVEDQQPQLSKLLKVLHKRRKIVVIAGAGISVSAGIPDFRSSTGLFRSLKSEHNLKTSGKQLFDMSVYKDADSTSSFHEMVRTMSQSTKTAAPTPFHHLLATLAQEGRLLRLYSQNVDGIDTSLPPLATQVPLRKENGAWPKTIQVHGSLHSMVCVKCHAVSDLDPELFDGPIAPSCPACEQQDTVRTEHAGKRSHGIGKLRPRMVMYNEQGAAFDDEAIGDVMKADLRTRPDALIVVGTSFKIPGTKRIAYEMCQTVRDRRDGLTVWINLDPAPADKKLEWDVIVKGSCDEVARHAALRKWDEDPIEFVKEEGVQPVSTIESVEVVIDSPAKARLAQQMPTPAASPNMAASKAKIVPMFDKGNGVIPLKTKLGGKRGVSKTKTPAAGKAAPKRKYTRKTDAQNAKVTEAFKISKGGAATMALSKAPAVSKSSADQDSPKVILKFSSTKPGVAKAASVKAQGGKRVIKQPSTPRRKLSPVSAFDVRNNGNPPTAEGKPSATTVAPAMTMGGQGDVAQAVLQGLSVMAPAPSPLTGHRTRTPETYVPEPVSPTPGGGAAGIGVRGKRVPMHERRRSETISPPCVPRDMRLLLD